MLVMQAHTNICVCVCVYVVRSYAKARSHMQEMQIM